MHKPEHNACPHCAGDRFKVAEAAKRMVLLEHDLEDARAAVDTASAANSSVADAIEVTPLP